MNTSTILPFFPRFFVVPVANRRVHQLARSAGLVMPMKHDEAAFTEKQNTHLWIVYRAAELLRYEGEAGQLAYDLLKPGQEKIGDLFHDNMCRGLYDPDHKAPYNDPLLPSGLCPTWKSHFYDPDTQTNWLGQETPTAVTRATTYYHLSHKAYRRGDMRVAGYALGLTLHYMGDLTQPMHSANFTWLSSRRFGYHTAFEQYAKTRLHTIDLPTRFKPLALGVLPQGYLKAIARRTKDTYFRKVCHPAWTQSYNKELITNEVWHQRVGPFIRDMLSDAVLMTAQYLLSWAESLLPTPTETRVFQPMGERPGQDLEYNGEEKTAPSFLLRAEENSFGITAHSNISSDRQGGELSARGREIDVRAIHHHATYPTT